MKAVIFDFNRTLYDPEQDKLIKGSSKVLNTLYKKTKLALVTTETGERLGLIKQLGIEKFFNKILIVGEKDKKSFLACCDALGVQPQDAVVVGDRIKGEIAIGNKLGMVTIQFKNGIFADQLPENEGEKPKMVITKLVDLLKILSDLK